MGGGGIGFSVSTTLRLITSALLSHSCTSQAVRSGVFYSLFKSFPHLSNSDVDYSLIIPVSGAWTLLGSTLHAESSFFSSSVLEVGPEDIFYHFGHVLSPPPSLLLPSPLSDYSHWF